MHPFSFTPARFWARVDKAGECWIWTAQTDRDGYGRLRVRGRRDGAHRVAWTLERGAIPAGLFVLHHCDNPRCVRPDHLFLGTNAENMADRNAKDRQARGERLAAPKRGQKNNLAKLTPDDIRAIRLSTESQATLGLRYGVAPHTICAVRTGRTWRHVA